MTSSLSPNTLAILLLTAPLIAGRGIVSPDLLSLGEYKKLAGHLKEIKQQPADLISTNASKVMDACKTVVEIDRLQRLLGRGLLLSLAIEHWRARAIWVFSRADPEYPQHFKKRLAEDAPPVIYGCGNVKLLKTGGLAVVGSRHVSEALIDYTMSVGRLAARTQKTIVSGGAKGIDQAAMQGALEVGGIACGVLPDNLEKTIMSREHRDLLINDQLVLISPYDPNAAFNVGHAMQRNKLIYALADASLVVNSDLKKGGTWAGATEQLDKLKYVPVYVRSTGMPSAGLDGLRKKGALLWPDPQDEESFKAVFDLEQMPDTNLQPAPSKPPIHRPSRDAASLLLIGDNSTTQPPSVESNKPLPDPTPLADGPPTPAKILSESVRNLILKHLKAPYKENVVAESLGVLKSQAKLWLQCLADENVLEKLGKGNAYIVKQKQLIE